MLHLNIIKYTNDICLDILFTLGGLTLKLSLISHDGLHGWEDSFFTEQNHTAKPKLYAKYLSF